MFGKSFAERITVRWAFVLLLIMVAGIGIRWGMVYHDFRAGQWGDERHYEPIGRNIAEGHGYSFRGRPTALRAPVAPLLVAAIYVFTPHDLLWARIFWSIMDVLTCVLIFYLTLLIGGTRLAGLVASALFSINPYFAFIGSHVMSETPFTILFLASLTLFVAYWRNKSWWWLCLSGVVMGLSILARPTACLYPVATVLLLFLGGHRHRSPWVMRAMVYTLMVGLTMAPWVIRNAIALKSFIPLTTFGGATLWCGSGAMPGGGLVIGPWADSKTYGTYAAMYQLSEVDADRYLRHEAMTAIRQHPGHWLKLGAIKFIRLWFRMARPGWTSLLGLFLVAVNAGILLLTWLNVRRSEHVMLRQSIVAVFIYYSVLHIITYAELRYSIPAYAYFLPFASIELINRCGTLPLVSK